MPRLAPLIHLLRRGRKGLRRYGFFGSVGHVWRSLASSRARRAALAADRAFDEEHGTDTGGILRLQGLQIPSENRDLGNRYQAVGPALFRDLIGAVPLDLSRYAFIDYGSGKGRALLLASEYPFRRVLGIEFAPELHEVAVRNISIFLRAPRACPRIESICADAVRFELPPEPSILFFNNPFEPVLMRKVLESVRRSFVAHPREIYLVLAGDTVHGPDIEAVGFRPLGDSGAASSFLDGRRRGIFLLAPA